MPRVSVIIPAYNSSEHIGSAIDSVLHQTFKDLEIIVIDDGSTDNTAELISMKYPSVRYLSKENGGASSARNLGVKISSGELIAFLDSDDEWHRDKLSAQVALMAKYPTADMCRTLVDERPMCSEPHIFKADSRLPPHRISQEFSESFQNPYFATSAIMVRKKAFDRVGGFDTSLKIAEDVDFYLRVLAESPILPIVTRVALNKRTVPGSLGEDSQAGYLQLVDVYNRFLSAHKEIEKLIGRRVVRKTFADLWARYAASLMRDRKYAHAFKYALKSTMLWPSALAAKVATKTLMLIARECPSHVRHKRS